MAQHEIDNYAISFPFRKRKISHAFIVMFSSLLRVQLNSEVHYRMNGQISGQTNEEKEMFPIMQKQKAQMIL